MKLGSHSTKRNRGFTLVEIMIVVAIVGMLAAIAIPSLQKARVDSIRAACVNNLRQMSAAKDVAALANSWGDADGPATIGNPRYFTVISQYIKGGQRPICPTGAPCYYNAIDESPTCRSGIATHVYKPRN